MKMKNDKGEQVYYNSAVKRGEYVWIIKGIGDTEVIGRDRQKLKSRTFKKESQADAYLKRHGFVCIG